MPVEEACVRTGMRQGCWLLGIVGYPAFDEMSLIDHDFSGRSGGEMCDCWSERLAEVVLVHRSAGGKWLSPEPRAGTVAKTQGCSPEQTFLEDKTSPRFLAERFQWIGGCLSHGEGCPQNEKSPGLGLGASAGPPCGG